MLALIISGSSVAYLAGAVLCGRSFYREQLEEAAQTTAARRQNDYMTRGSGRIPVVDPHPLIDDEDRSRAWWGGFWIGALWPPVLVFVGICLLFTETLPPVVPPTERARRDQVARAEREARDAAELANFRRLAAEHKLPTGDEPANLPEP